MGRVRREMCKNGYGGEMGMWRSLTNIVVPSYGKVDAKSEKKLDTASSGEGTLRAITQGGTASRI